MNNMNYSRYMHSMCCVDSNKIIITGSMLDEIVSKKCESYDITKNVFQELPEMNEGRFKHSSCTFNSHVVFVVGGVN